MLRHGSGQGRRFHRLKRQSIAKSYSRWNGTATAFASLPGAVAGCFRNREGANSPARTGRNRPIMLGEEKAAG